MVASFQERNLDAERKETLRRVRPRESTVEESSDRADDVMLVSRGGSCDAQ